MRLIKIAIILVCTAAVIIFLRQGQGFPLPRVLPACDGHEVNSAYLIGGIVLIALMFRGLRRLHSSSEGTDEQDDE